MTISLSAETQKLLKEQLQRYGYDSPDRTVRAALELLRDQQGDAIEDLPDDTRDAIERALAQSDLGEGRPWSEVRAELHDRFVK